MLLIQVLPLAALVALLATGRARPPLACAAAIVLALPAAWLHLGDAAGLPGLAWFLVRSLAEGAWLAVVPVGIITGGLLFHEAVAGQGHVSSSGSAADRLFTGAFLLGPFTEAVTGFGVGTVFASGAVRAAGAVGAPAAAIALMAQVLIPWGGLGPGTAIGAALAGVDAQAMATRNAWNLAPALIGLLPLFWWWCKLSGHAPTARAKAGQMGWIAALGVLLVAAHDVLPWELCGMFATGVVLAGRLLATDPPRHLEAWRRAAVSVAPYLLLATLLVLLRLWPNPPTLRPDPGLPPLPANHAVVALWLAALTLLTLRGRRLAQCLAALSRGRRTALTLLMFVVLARVLVDAGVPQALATALVGSMGAAAPYASPILAGASGFFAGTNVGSNSAMMTLQAALGRAAGMDPVVLPAVQNGTLLLIISPQLVAISASLAGGVTAGPIWRIMWPIAALSVIVGGISIAIG